MSEKQTFLSKLVAPFASMQKSFRGAFNVHQGLPANPRSWDGNDFLKANSLSVYVNRAIDLRAQKIGETEFVMRDDNGEIIEKENPLLNLLYKPNAMYTGRMFWALQQKYLDLTGVAYIRMIGTSTAEREIFEPKKVRSLELLEPNRTTPKFDENGEVLHYEYKKANGSTEHIPAHEVIYRFRPDPENPRKGISLIKAAVQAIQTEIQISTYHARVIQNGGKVEGVFSFKNAALTKEKHEALKDGYSKEYAEAKRAGRPLFLSGDTEYHRVGLTPDELSYSGAKAGVLEDISIITGVPKEMMASFSGTQYNNSQASLRVFLGQTMRPEIMGLVTALDEVLFPAGENLSFIDRTPEDVDEKFKSIDTGMKTGYMTVNEARKRDNLDAVDGGDVFLRPFTVQEVDESGKKKVPEPVESEKRAKSADDHPLKDPEVRKVYHAVMVKRMDAREVIFKRVLTRYLKEQSERLIEQLQPQKRKTVKKKGLLDDTFNLTLEVKIGKEMFLPILTELLREAGDDALTLVGKDRTLYMGPDIVSWIDSKADVFLNQINLTTFEELKTQFEESFAAGEARGDLIKRIQDTYGDIGEARANTIARTEVHAYTQYGTLKGYEQAGMDIKIWVSVLDNETRGNKPKDIANHIVLDGEERPLYTPFSNGLMYPGDTAGGAAEVINCRCSI